jgi:hypothetical protein
MEMIFAESNLSSLDRAFLVIEKQNDIAIGRAMLEYETYCKMDSIYYEKFGKKDQETEDDDGYEEYDDDEESDDNPKKKQNKIVAGLSKIKVFQKICDAMTAFVHSIEHMFQNMFGKGMVNADEYFKSSTAKIKMEENKEKYTEEVNRQLVEGQRLIQKIANKTGYDAYEISNYLEFGASIANENKEKICSAGLGWTMNKYMQKVFRNGNKMTRKMRREIQNANLSDKELDDAIKVANKMNSILRGLGKEQKSLAKKLFSIFNKKGQKNG